MGLHEMIIDAEEALDAIETPNLLDRVLVALGVRLLLGSISAEVEEGEARVEEVGHFGLLGPPGAPRWPLGTPRRRRGAPRSRALPKLSGAPKGFCPRDGVRQLAECSLYLLAVWGPLATARAVALASDALRGQKACARRRASGRVR